jgi:hypothetical protein
VRRFLKHNLYLLLQVLLLIQSQLQQQLLWGYLLVLQGCSAASGLCSTQMLWPTISL